MCSCIMDTVLHKIPQNGKFIPTPGNKSVIGATATQFRLKQSAPNLPRRFEASTVGKRAAKLGSDSANGEDRDAFSGARPCEIRTYTVKDSRLRNRGFKITDIKPSQDRLEMERLNEVPRYAWKLKVNEATSNYGVLFENLPGGYGPAPGSLLRGNNYPSSTVILGNSAPEDSLNEQILAQRVARQTPLQPINYTPRYTTQ